jgi:hypothetical protein
VQSVHKEELRATNPRHVDKRHKEEYVSWFECKVSSLVPYIFIHILFVKFSHAFGYFISP